MSEHNEASVETNCFRGGFTLKASRLGATVLRSAVLAPSVLGSSSNTSTSLAGSETAKAADGAGERDNMSNNPFLRESKDDEEEDDTVQVVAAAESSTEKKDDETDERPDPLTKLRSNGIERSSMFAAAKTNMPHVQSSGYVFGQNVHERVVAPPELASTDPHSAESAPVAATSTSATSSSSTTLSAPQLLFSSVIQKADEEGACSSSSAAANNNSKEVPEGKSLTEVAREYEESRAQKRKYEEVETFTGEENELNIVDVSCKLFAFVNSNWEERGRGSLRLNDGKDGRDSSRVVFRTSGNLRLLLNTKVWAAMVAERASQKSLRLTAIDNSGSIKIFLAMGRPADIAQLHKALSERIAKRKITHPEEISMEETKNGVATEVAVSLQPESTTHDDEDDTDDGATTTTTVIAEPDSNEPSPKKKSAVVQPDSSADLPEAAVQLQDNEDGEAEAEAEAKMQN
ncbi:uncharacterized protein Dwil_GK10849 [Drosophila willistoni]|uniref:RanBD1 domain-containing protein n=1 Tax=Drosophila willistoni TaxID=7260 RepID=B4N9Z9_DROWI|nr:ran-binding protein 3 [Drosophila willistoni]EDW81754.1 uncharacterized protein Dwil_GK10849 [Drosophila willistoni]